MLDRHQGNRDSGPLTQRADRRVQQLYEQFQSFSPIHPTRPPIADPFRSSILLRQHQTFGPPLTVGTIVHSIDFINWYKVQLGINGGWIGCCALSNSSFLPLGVRSGSLLAPGSRVLVFQPPDLGYGIILGVLPEITVDGNVYVPSWLVQGGQSGLKREAAHLFVIQSMFQAGGTIDFSSQRPIDSTPFEWTKVSDTGIAVLIDAWQAFLRVHEMCGLFLSYWDGHTRLAGNQLLIESLIHHEQAYNDEGESRYERHVAIYPWESLGLRAPGVATWTAEFDAKDVQYSLAKGAIDLPDDAEDTQPFRRWREYAGYVGQAYTRFLAAPPQGDIPNVNLYSAPEDDIGLFHENVALDGSYLLRSAKSLAIVKRGKIVIPKEIKLPDHADGGDDARNDKYRFSGTFGTGPEHAIGDVRVEGRFLCMRRAAAVLDLLAYATNWKSLSGFVQHTGDYRTIEEINTKDMPRTSELLDFDELGTLPYIHDPTPFTLNIDHRYGDVDYYERECGIVWGEDGSLTAFGGCAERILMAGGNLRIEAPGNLELVAGKRIVLVAREVITRAAGSIDMTSGSGDVRIKADRNLHMLGGNSGEGGILIECLSATPAQDYTDLIGEDIISSGIVFRAQSGQVAVLSQDIYLRTGGPGPLGAGTITFDAGVGRQDIVFQANALNIFTVDGVNCWNTSVAGSGNLVKTHRLGPDVTIIDSDAYFGGRIVGFGTGAGITVDGPVAASGNIACGGRVADSRGGQLGVVPFDFTNTVSDATNRGGNVENAQLFAGEGVYNDALTAKYYAAGSLGNTELLVDLHFSLRDDDSQAQYGSANTVWVEPYWQQFARLGLATGGAPWNETAVNYQGRELYPWPGREKWLVDRAFLQLAAHEMYDPENGAAQHRDTPYLTPALANWNSVPLSTGFRVIE